MKMSHCVPISVGAVATSPLAVPAYCWAPSSPGEEPSALSTARQAAGQILSSWDGD